GKALIVKTAIFFGALLLAGFHRWFLVPAMAKPGKVAATRARRFFSRTLPLEAMLAIGILATTGLLTSLAPANAQGSATAQTRTIGSTNILFDVVPLRIGPNLFQVTLTQHGQAIDNADKVELQLTMLDMDMGSSVLDLEPKGQGVYSAQGDLLSMGGRWKLDLLVRLPGQLDQRTTFNLTVKP
ncbi:MAG: FixH family protein, partial [Chloroflexi bacterium]|nr:FixH family protein [Chloroflexota bacterium]